MLFTEGYEADMIMPKKIRKKMCSFSILFSRPVCVNYDYPKTSPPSLTGPDFH